MTSGAAPDPAVVVAGDALVDLTPTTSVNGTAAYEPHPGGSSLNVAVGLGRLGVPVALLARVSTDGFGRLLRDHLSDSAVSPDFLVETDDPTTLAAVVLAPFHCDSSLGVAMLAGALFGAVLYMVNFYGMVQIFQWSWLQDLRGWATFIVHVLFGIIALPVVTGRATA